MSCVGCEYCHQWPHARGCPNEPETATIYRCLICNTKILDGDRYFKVDDEPFCEGCVSHKIARIDIDEEC